VGGYPARSENWFDLLDKQGLQGDFHQFFQIPEGKSHLEIAYLRLNIFPDGGIARLRVFGKPKGINITDQK
jgi:allantoicase